MRIRSGWILAGAATYVTGSTATFIYLRSRKDAREHACTSGAVWDSLADTYDSQVGLDETLMGLRLLRRFVIRQAQASTYQHRTSPPPPFRTLAQQSPRALSMRRSPGVVLQIALDALLVPSKHHAYAVQQFFRETAVSVSINAQGDVLEMSAGTGRNMPYYCWDKLSSLTVTDSSRHMLFHAKQKVRCRQQ